MTGMKKLVKPFARLLIKAKFIRVLLGVKRKIEI
jgi:hypothetical protein